MSSCSRPRGDRDRHPSGGAHRRGRVRADARGGEPRSPHGPCRGRHDEELHRRCGRHRHRGSHLRAGRDRRSRAGGPDGHGGGRHAHGGSRRCPREGGAIPPTRSAACRPRHHRRNHRRELQWILAGALRGCPRPVDRNPDRAPRRHRRAFRRSRREERRRLRSQQADHRIVRHPRGDRRGHAQGAPGAHREGRRRCDVRPRSRRVRRGQRDRACGIAPRSGRRRAHGSR